MVCTALPLCSSSRPWRSAQFTATPFSDPATGERYHIEASFGWWNPSPDFQIASESLGVLGTVIDAVDDLGIEKKQIPELRIVLRPGRKHKFRVDYLPMSYSASSTVHREFVFNGIKYNVNLPVSTELSWKTWHLGYEYDFIYRDRGFVGIVLQAKATDIQASIQAAALGREFARAQAPVPAIGGIGRVYVVPNISITGELDFLKIPEADRRALSGALLGLRSVRHGELQRLRRRADRLPQPRPRLRVRRRPRGLQGEGNLLRRSG